MEFPLRRKISLKFYTKVEINNLYSTMCNVNIEHNFEMVCNWILYSVDLAWQWQKSHSLSCQNCSKSRIICYAKNVENHAIFVEGFWQEFFARGRFMKYSMSDMKQICSQILVSFSFWVYLNSCLIQNI